ncbi:MAG: hypothetical protein ACRDPT_13580 [Streptomycetales bacterium]
MTERNSDLATALRRQLTKELERRGDLRSPEWRAAVEAVPRDEFLRDGFFQPLDADEQSRWEPVSPDHVSGRSWLRLVYSDQTW